MTWTGTDTVSYCPRVRAFSPLSPHWIDQVPVSGMNTSTVRWLCSPVPF